eukprot:scpid100603/ scgid1582/ Histidine triad nucleotide-binding protein 2, mitochondrial; HINT-3
MDAICALVGSIAEYFTNIWEYFFGPTTSAIADQTPGAKLTPEEAMAKAAKKPAKDAPAGAKKAVPAAKKAAAAAKKGGAAAKAPARAAAKAPAKAAAQKAPAKAAAQKAPAKAAAKAPAKAATKAPAKAATTAPATSATTAPAKGATMKAPADAIFQDDQVVAENKKAPEAPVHFIVWPKRVITRLGDVTEADEPLLGHMMNVARQIAQSRGIHVKGYRIFINHGKPGGQTDRLHVEILGGKVIAGVPKC